MLTLICDNDEIMQNCVEGTTADLGRNSARMRWSWLVNTLILTWCALLQAHHKVGIIVPPPHQYITNYERTMDTEPLSDICAHSTTNVFETLIFPRSHNTVGNATSHSGPTTTIFTLPLQNANNLINLHVSIARACVRWQRTRMKL